MNNKNDIIVIVCTSLTLLILSGLILYWSNQPQLYVNVTAIENAISLKKDSVTEGQNVILLERVLDYAKANNDFIDKLKLMLSCLCFVLTCLSLLQLLCAFRVYNSRRTTQNDKIDG